MVEIENAEKEEAGQAALVWYRRLNFEGGILKAKEIDARGLLGVSGFHKHLKMRISRICCAKVTSR